MMHFAAAHGTVFVNNTERHQPVAHGGSIPPRTAAAVAGLLHRSGKRSDQSAPSATPTGRTKTHVFDLKRDKKLFCLSPQIVTRKDQQRLTYPAAAEIIGAFPIGQSLIKELGKSGLFSFIDKLKTEELRSYYRASLNLLLASLCVSTEGASTIRELPPAAYLAWLSFFRTADGLRWRRDLWGPGFAVPFQCLKELTLAFSRFTGDAEVAKHASQARLKANGVESWKSIVENTSGVEAEWLELFDGWRSTVRANRSDSRHMLRSAVEWAQKEFPGASVAEIMMIRKRKQTFPKYLMERSEGSLSQYGAYVRLAVRFSSFVENELRGRDIDDALWPLATEADVERAEMMRAAIGGTVGKHAETRSRPLPSRLQPIVDEILAEGEAGWPGQSGLFHVTVFDKNGTSSRVYCPVLPTLFQALLVLPLRAAQVIRLDSGEGDSETFNGETLKWEVNQGPLANFWKRSGDRAGKLRGYACRLGDSSAPVSGFFINTNKTGDAYTIPWEHPRLHRILWNLKQWQQKFMPVTKPIRPIDYVEQTDKVDEAHLGKLPDIFPLFGMPANGRNGRIWAPPTYRQRDAAWQNIMAETERRWNDRNPDEPIQIVSRQAKTGQAQSAIYNIHGLRVAGLTRLFMAGVPIEILSKVVAGHHSLLMTLYYLKFEPAHIHRILEEAALHTDTIAAQEFIEGMTSWTLEEAKRRAAFLQEDGVTAATEMGAGARLQFVDVQIGMCPWDGTRCSDGGPLLRREKRPDGNYRTTHGPVEGGSNNCIMCRHFISGPAWRKQLWLYGSSLLDRFTQTTSRLEDLQARREKLTTQRNAATGSSQRLMIQRQESALDIQVDALVSVQELLLKSIHQIDRLLNICEQIRLNDFPGTKKAGNDLVTQDATSIIEYVATTEFERSAVLTAASRVYTVLHNAETEAKRNTFLDRVMFENGGTPLSMRPLTEEQKKHGQDALARLLMERLNREETQALVNGDLRLQDLKMVDAVEGIVRQKLGKPMPIVAIDHTQDDLLMPATD